LWRDVLNHGANCKTLLCEREWSSCVLAIEDDAGIMQPLSQAVWYEAKGDGD